MASSCFLTLLEKLRAKEWERVEDDGGGGRKAEGERRGEGFAFCEAFLLILERVSTSLEDSPQSSSNEDPIFFDTSIISWWAWMKRFHLREAELLNGRAAMAGRA